MNFTGFKDEFQPRILLPSLTAGLIAAVITISLEISLAALIFSGDLTPFLAGGIGLMLRLIAQWQICTMQHRRRKLSLATI